MKAGRACPPRSGQSHPGAHYESQRRQDHQEVSKTPQIRFVRIRYLQSPWWPSSLGSEMSPAPIVFTTSVSRRSSFSISTRACRANATEPTERVVLASFWGCPFGGLPPWTAEQGTGHDPDEEDCHSSAEVPVPGNVGSSFQVQAA